MRDQRSQLVIHKLKIFVIGSTLHPISVKAVIQDGNNIVLRSSDGAESTTIDGGAIGSVMPFSNGEDSTAILSGFTLRNGTGTMIKETQSKGGGINCTGSSPTLKNLKIINNTATTRGGGIHC